MKFSLNVAGPDFDDAAIVNFEFAQAALTFRLPKHQSNYGLPILAKPDLQDISSFEGELREHPFGYLYRKIVQQSWYYFDENTQNKVVKFRLDVEHMNLLPEQVESNMALRPEKLNQWLFDFLRVMSVDGDESLLGTPAERENMIADEMPLSIDEFEYAKGGLLPWPMVTFGNRSGEEPEWQIYIPLDRSSLLELRLDVGVFHYHDQGISIPQEQQDQLRRDIRDEFLSHIHINYSPELLAELGA